MLSYPVDNSIFVLDTDFLDTEYLATVAASLHHLTNKNTGFNWTGDSLKAFEILKSKLIEAHMLSYPVDNSIFVLDTDASNVGVGAVLSQVVDGVEKICWHMVV